MIEQISLFSNAHHVILGDLNAQNSLWGSTLNLTGGHISENFADDRELIILNDASPTLFNTRNTVKSVDVSMCSADLAPQ